MRAALAALGLALSLLPGHRPAAATAHDRNEPEPLTLDEVLEAVDVSYPLLLAAEADRRAVAGRLKSARGSFDTLLRTEGDFRPAGFYQNYGGGGVVEQPTQLWGARFFAGYRIASGDFPSYDGARETKDGGEFRGGFELPLVRGGPIDGPRARLRQAEIDLRRIDPEIALQRIDFRRQASLAYWDWIAFERIVGVEERLLDTAEARQGQIEGRVARGALPQIDLSDNERLIVDRRIRLLGAERDAEQSAIQLSLFLRDGEGNPVIVTAARLPPDFPREDDPTPQRLARDVERAEADHPLLRALGLQIDRAEVDLELARNDALPSVDLRFEGSQDIGGGFPGISSEGSISPNPRRKTEVKALVKFELPVQRREAKGRAEAARARVARLDNQRRFARDRIVTEIRRAMAALEAAFAQTQAARRNLELARELQRAEERKLMLGNSNLINVNIREIQAAEAGQALIRAQAEYFRADAEYRAAVAVGP